MIQYRELLILLFLIVLDHEFFQIDFIVKYIFRLNRHAFAALYIVLEPSLVKK